MRIEIFDVGHGGCAVITGPNGKQLMLDCGYGTAPFWFPSEEYRGKRLECLAFMNLDEDHLDDLPRLWKNADIGAIYSNPTVTDEALAFMKRQHGMNDGVRFAHGLLNHSGQVVLERSPISVLKFEYGPIVTPMETHSRIQTT